ncbi:MAG: Acetyl-coenzyme A carboxylase carboxyl transferase subunit beta [Alphaproteobacteria bacterium MarineAlpha5_Bin9]|mgnify:CR=1 FL=1|nr:MAG: Acetyl-coenzyme A carboxylase carboxyl transferase subunit beta [Alphaproteobacteria bacterium MarineAlpha5_Bin9]|tara:strand:+ start:4640 stop:5488 length:849 start_codon:yes stop_codon:yes gene_type:complete
MNWLTDFVKPKLSALVSKRKDIPENLWQNCPKCKKMLHHKDLQENLNICTECNFHFRISIDKRIESLFGKKNFNEIAIDKVIEDPLKFVDKKKYTDRLKEYRKKTNREDAIVLGRTNIGSINIIVGLMNFDFMGGSMGKYVGSAIVKASNICLEENKPLILFTSSGGARMQEGIVSLMQMPKTVAAVQKLSKKNIPYIVVLTDPTTGGVTASFAMLADILIAENDSTIGFAGKRVIQDTIREDLPSNFQKSEYLKEHGMVDVVVDRKNLYQKLLIILSHLQK